MGTFFVRVLFLYLSHPFLYSKGIYRSTTCRNSHCTFHIEEVSPVGTRLIDVYYVMINNLSIGGKSYPTQLIIFELIKFDINPRNVLVDLAWSADWLQKEGNSNWSW